jgi:hypothetical protein
LGASESGRWWGRAAEGTIVKKHIELDRRFYRLAEDADAFPEDTTYFGDSEYVTEAGRSC